MTPERIAEIREAIELSRRNANMALQVEGKSYRGTQHLNAVSCSEELLTAVETLQQDNARLRAALVQAKDDANPQACDERESLYDALRADDFNNSGD